MKNLSIEQNHQILHFQTSFIEYPAITEIFSILDQLRFDQARMSETESMLLIGESGSGKTALIQHYLSRKSTKESKYIQPILSTRVPSQIKEKDLLAEFLMDLSSESSGRSIRPPKQALMKGLLKILQRKKTELIIVNEAQELIENASARDLRTIANTLKQISEYAKVSFVLVGMPYSKAIINEPQWKTRLPWRRELNYFKLLKPTYTDKMVHTGFEIDEELKEHFALFVDELAEAMGYDKKPNLITNEILYPLFSMCRGECRKLKHFLKDAMVISFQRDKTHLDKDDLLRAFSFKFPTEKNPFSCDIGEISFSQIEASSTFNSNAVLAEDRIKEARFTDRISLGLLLRKNSKGFK